METVFAAYDQSQPWISLVTAEWQREQTIIIHIRQVEEVIRHVD